MHRAIEDGRLHANLRVDFTIEIDQLVIFRVALSVVHAEEAPLPHALWRELVRTDGVTGGVGRSSGAVSCDLESEVKYVTCIDCLGKGDQKGQDCS